MSNPPPPLLLLLLDAVGLPTPAAVVEVSFAVVGVPLSVVGTEAGIVPLILETRGSLDEGLTSEAKLSREVDVVLVRSEEVVGSVAELVTVDAGLPSNSDVALRFKTSAMTEERTVMLFSCFEYRSLLLVFCCCYDLPSEGLSITHVRFFGRSNSAGEANFRPNYTVFDAVE